METDKPRRRGATAGGELQRPTARTDPPEIAPAAAVSPAGHEPTTFPRRAKQAKHATRASKPKRRRSTKPEAPPFVIVPKKGKPGSMILDPLRMPDPPLTTDVKHAKLFHGRASAHKFLSRNPALKKRFNYQRVS